MISEGNNFPKINLDNDNLKEICVLIHNKISLNGIKEFFDLSQSQLDKRLESLLTEELLTKEFDEYKPNFMVISLHEGKELYKDLDEIAFKISSLIKINLDNLKKETYKFHCFKGFDFSKLSLFILSDVIMDFIQINNVEKCFLKSERTTRNGMNYYYSLQEKHKNSSIEALGIYGNMSRTYGDIEFGLYGNKRNGINFHTIDLPHLEKYFGSFDSKNEGMVKKYLLEELLKVHTQKGYSLKENIIEGFNRLDIMDGNRINIPILTEDDFTRLDNIAQVIKDEFLEILHEYREDIYSKYHNSLYSKEISFEEYYIWWYHLLYSRATEMLINQGVIHIPKTHNFSYVIQ